MRVHPTVSSTSARLSCVLIGALCCGSETVVQAQQGTEVLRNVLTTLSSERMLADVRTLSGPDFNGRQAGTDDDRRSAAWVGDRFKSFGLSPAATAGEPGFMISAMLVPTIDPNPMLQIGSIESMQHQRIGADFFPILDSPSADVQAPVVFVGYGTAGDYAAVDVTNCIVLFLRGKPDHSTAPISHLEKVRLARAKGALAYFTATGPILNSYETRRGITGQPSAFYAQMPVTEALPGAWISTRAAETLLAGSGDGSADRLRALQEQLNKTPTARSVRTGSQASLSWKTTVREGRLVNVSALLPGTGAGTVVVGAHRDHFGRTAGLLFPGADDNASGTAVMLEVARALTQADWRPKRTILFVSFGGEEKDLLGSRLYVAAPPVPLLSTNAMVNIDHAGVGNGRLTVGVTGLEKSTAQEAGQLAGLADRLDFFGFFPGGDQVPFKEAGVPTVTVVSGGIHPHFHQPTDAAETINPEILNNAARYVLALLWRLANDPDRPVP